MNCRAKHLLQTMLTAALYAAAFRFAWMNSEDQLYLPAGLRIAALLFAPYRFWPAIFAGDAVAMLGIRLPITDEEGAHPLWTYASSLLLCPIVALAPLAIRMRFPAAMVNARFLPLLMMACAVWGAVVSTSLNCFFGGPMDSDIVSYIYRLSIGEYLAIMIATLPVMLWKNRKEVAHTPPNLARNTIAAIAGLTSAYATLQLAALPWEKLLLLGSMLLPPIVLCMLHGWKGAAIGMLAATVSLGLAVPDTGLLGNKDLLVFVAEQSLAVVGTVLMALGSAVSKEYDTHSRLQIASQDALRLAQCNCLSAEMLLRTHAQAIANAQVEIDAGYHDLARRLKAEGRYSLALDVNTQGFNNSQMLFKHVTSIYPLEIDSLGLKQLLQSDEFVGIAYSDVVKVSLKGSMEQHSHTLQLVAHRSIGHAIELLPPGTKHLHVRAWTLGRRRGISVSVRCTSPATLALDLDAMRSAEIQLQAKLQAYSGKFKRRCRRVMLTLSEDLDQRSEAAAINHDTRLPVFTALTTKRSDL
ncbi:MASE1 domain-containing protein [Xanthomonas albilineans]|uniref:MASE1 domain-containing protein n=1 Tax=Xanthomonas albilineans TaxID=29447 RepID=UPI0009B9CFDF|nr:MASE1 domain-containing protein [Xanthomonas albilineans]